MTQPVIVLGMHRSGTSMLIRQLGKLGLFTGADLDANSEARFFRRVNMWLLSQSGARWDEPAAFELFYENERALALTEEYVAHIVDGPRSSSFIGLGRYLAGSRIRRLAAPWGWKDPRNTFTLEFWLRLFPEAKVIHIERHGVDVAQSLLQRTRRFAAEAERRLPRYKLGAVVRLKRLGFVDSYRCSTLEGGLALWTEYMERAQRAKSIIPRERSLTLRYEQMLQDPEASLRVAAVFSGLSPSPEDIRSTADGLDASRAYAFAGDEALSSFAREHRAELSAYGYGSLEGCAER